MRVLKLAGIPMQSNDPLHGKTLEAIINELVERYGWEELGERINIRCFTHDPSVKSSLKFLRKTPWARDKVEQLYIKMVTGKRPKPTARKPADNKPAKPAGDPWAKYR